MCRANQIYCNCDENVANNNKQHPKNRRCQEVRTQQSAIPKQANDEIFSSRLDFIELSKNMIFSLELLVSSVRFQHGRIRPSVA